VTAVLVTRPAGDGDPLVERLRGLGLEVVAVPTVLTRRLDVTWPDLTSFDWIVVTSAAGAAALPPVPQGVRIAAVGAATAAALKERGIAVAMVPAESSGLGIASELEAAAGARVLLARASGAAPDLPEALRHRGATVEEVVAYETVEGPEESRPALRDALSAGLAAAVFASGSAARGYLLLGGEVSVPAVTIGPRTSAAARELGFNVAAEADATDATSLAAAVERVARAQAGRHA
jgi:uroporphyrinogen-III synthase